MKNFIALTLSIIMLVLTKSSYAQIKVSLAKKQAWNAQWIAAPNDAGINYGVYYFRKSIALSDKPKSFIVHISADNRYKLYVNGRLTSLGPTRGDIYHWNYETVDLAPYLKAGENVIAALVWNEAQYRPEAQISFRTAFIVQGNSRAEEVLNTNSTWKCIRDNAYQPLPGYFAASTGEMVDMNQTVPGWNKLEFDDSAWTDAINLFAGVIKGSSDGFGFELVPSALPPREMTYQRIPALRQVSGIPAPAGFPGRRVHFIIPANTQATLLLDQTFETNAYVTLNYSGGKDAGISLSYAETLYDYYSRRGIRQENRKGNRNEVKGKEFSGREDSVVSNGKINQSYTTLNFRTYRYIQLIIRTKDEPLEVNDLYGTFTAYPFKMRAVLNTDNKEMKQMLSIGWRTARLNAWETYTDCPYYEQLQYIGDTRVQAMVSYYNSGDDRLARNAINLLDHSRLSSGLTLSRFPTHGIQIIPTFSLWYIGMLYDYWMYRDDDGFIKNKLEGERAILNFFSKYEQADGSIKDLPYWIFVDWADGKDWHHGAPPIDRDGSSAIIDLQVLWAYEWAARMETKLGIPCYADLYNKKITRLKQTIQRKYWDESKGLYSDTGDKTDFSQHANSLAILTGMLKKSEMAVLAKKLLSDTTLTQCTIYFKYYLHQALVKAGLGNDYMNWLGIWRENIKMGLTTWSETSNLQNTRSDCHAWGSSPNIEFFRTVLGIDSYAPGFEKIKIEPHLDTITNISGSIPHPNGKVYVKYKLEKNKWRININLPQNTSGVFMWREKSYLLKEGNNSFIL